MLGQCTHCTLACHTAFCIGVEEGTQDSTRAFVVGRTGHCKVRCRCCRCTLCKHNSATLKNCRTAIILAVWTTTGCNVQRYSTRTRISQQLANSSRIYRRGHSSIRVRCRRGGVAGQPNRSAHGPYTLCTTTAIMQTLCTAGSSSGFSTAIIRAAHITAVYGRYVADHAIKAPL